MGAFRSALAKESNAEVPLDAVSGGAIVTRPALGNNTNSSSSSSNNKKRPVLPAVTPPASKQQRLPNTAASATSSTSSSSRVSLSPAPPGSLAAAAASTAARSLPKYEERKGAGQVVVTFDPHQVGVGASVSPLPSTQPKCTVSYEFPTNVSASYRHMFTTLTERAHALDQQLVDTSRVLMQRYGLAAAEATAVAEHKDGDEQEEKASGGGTSTSANGIAPLEAVGIPRQEPICCIGRICNAVRVIIVEWSCIYVHACLTNFFFRQLVHTFNKTTGSRRSSQRRFGALGRISSRVGRSSRRVGPFAPHGAQTTLFVVSRSNCGRRRHEYIGTQIGRPAHL